MQPCEQADTIKDIEKRLGKGEVLFATTVQTLDGHTEMLQRIESQTTKTNGRVNGLEDFRDGVVLEVKKLQKIKTGIVWMIFGVAVASADGPEMLKNLMEILAP